MISCWVTASQVMPEGSGLGAGHVEVHRVATRSADSVAAWAVAGARTVTAPPTSASARKDRKTRNKVMRKPPEPEQAGSP